MNCRGCGAEILLVVKNPVGGLAEPDHSEADCLVGKLDACQRDLKQAGQWLAESGATNQKLQSRLEEVSKANRTLADAMAKIRNEAWDWREKGKRPELALVNIRSIVSGPDDDSVVERQG